MVEVVEKITGNKRKVITISKENESLFEKGDHVIIKKIEEFKDENKFRN